MARKSKSRLRSKSRKSHSRRKSRVSIPVKHRIKNSPCARYAKFSCGLVDPECQWTKRGCKQKKGRSGLVVKEASLEASLASLLNLPIIQSTVSPEIFQY